MAQHDYVIANGTGAAVRSDLNAGFAAIVSQNSGATAPSTTYAYQSWADTSAGVMKMRNGANNAWISLYQLDGEWTSIAFENGTAAAPSIYFKDSGTDTGIYSPGADQVAISTGGTSRLAVSTTAVSSTLAVDVPLGAVGTPSITFTGDLNTGVFSPGADTLALVTGGTNRVHVTSGGLVGIGTTSPGGVLEAGAVSGAVTSGDLLVTTGSTTAKVTIGRLSGTSSDNTSFRIRDRIDRDVLTVDTNNFIYSQGGSERCRVDASGRLLVGTTNTNPFGNSVAGTVILSDGLINISRDGDYALAVNRMNSDGQIILFGRNGSAVGNISVTTTATAYNTSSDYRLKENVTPIANGITRLLQLKPSQFNFKADPSHTVDGFLAHEAQAVVPECVTGEKDVVDADGNPVYQGIDQSKLVPLLTAALQEAISRIETLEARLSALEGA